MIECKSIEEALKVENVFHIALGNPIIAYQRGDELPDHAKTDEERGIAPVEPVNEIEQLKARIAALESAVSRR